jgi:hypothetical protein
MLQFLPYALAAYGGYKGYKASKEAGGSGLQRLLGAATGATLGYYGGRMVPGVSAAGFGNLASANYIPTFSNLTPVSAIRSSIPFLANTQPSTAFTSTGSAAARDLGVMGIPGGPGTAISSTQRASSFPGAGILDIFKSQNAKGERAYDPLKIGLGVGALSYFGGAFDPQPQDVYTPTYNLAVAELQRQRGGFKYIDPVTGDEKTFDQPYIPEAGRTPQYTLGPYELQKSTFNEGGLAQINKFNEGGINYLPSKVTHDENDSNNYMRAQGYVEDGSGNGDKDEDTMLAQLADGEFVTRADGVLGAGIIAGANPKSMKDMREKGAQYFYEQQKRFKRIFDLLEGSRNAKAKLN